MRTTEGLLERGQAILYEIGIPVAMIVNIYDSLFVPEAADHDYHV